MTVMYNPTVSAIKPFFSLCKMNIIVGHMKIYRFHVYVVFHCMQKAIKIHLSCSITANRAIPKEID